MPRPDENGVSLAGRHIPSPGPMRIAPPLFPGRTITAP